MGQSYCTNWRWKDAISPSFYFFTLTDSLSLSLSWTDSRAMVNFFTLTLSDAMRGGQSPTYAYITGGGSSTGILLSWRGTFGSDECTITPFEKKHYTFLIIGSKFQWFKNCMLATLSNFFFPFFSKIFKNLKEEND